MAAADGSGLVICLLQQQHLLFLIHKGLNYKSSSAGAKLGWLRDCAFVAMVSNSPEESESSQSLSDSGCSRNRSPARKQQLDLSMPSGAQQNVELRRTASVPKAESSSKGHPVEASSAKDDTMVMQEDIQLAPNKKRQRSASPEQVQVKATDATACRPVPYVPSLNKSPQPQGDTQSRSLWWLTPENAAFSQAGAPAPAPAPATRLQYSPLMPRTLEGRETRQFQELSSSSSAQHRQVIRPTSIPHERAVFNFGFDTSAAEAAGSRMSSDVHMLDSSPRLSRVGEGAAAAAATGDVVGRKSFVEWRPMLSESGHHPRPPSVAQVPVWNQERALPPQGSPSLNYLGMVAGPSSLASQAHAGAFSSMLRPNMNFPLTTYSGMSHSHHQGWGTPDQLNAMQNMAAGFFPGQERPRAEASSGLLFLGPSEKNRPLGTQPPPSIAVVMDGRSIGGSICLRDYDSYASFATAIRAMLSGGARQGAPEECNLSNAVPGHIIAYEDAEGDVLLAGDLSWRDFVRAAKRIRILSAKGRSVVAVP